jgi:hypothetical protein
MSIKNRSKQWGENRVEGNKKRALLDDDGKAR